MELYLQLLVYLDKKQVLTDMKNLCATFLKELNEKTISKFPPLRYSFLVDVMDLLELFPEVGENLIREPLKWQRNCNDILFACLKSLDNDNIQYYVRTSQVAVNIRLKCLPQILSDAKLHKYNGIVAFVGLLVDVSKVTNYVYHTVWSCSEECEGNEVILQYIPKVPPKCYLCGSVLFENSGLRRCGDQVEIMLMVKNELLPKKYIVVDDLIPKLTIGATYVINAIILKTTASIWSVEYTSNVPAPVTSPIPPDIKQLFTICDDKPWRFIYGIASRIGINVCPSNCFMNVKISLLMSLVSVKANIFGNSEILHGLAAGFDTTYIPELMKHTSLLANSNTFLGMSNSSTSATLIAASGGICIMGLPLQSYNHRLIHSVLQAIETGEFHHGPHRVKLKCAIWAHGKDFKNIVLNDIGNVFGTICRADNGEYNDELADFILQQGVELPKITREIKKSLQDISIYIDLVASIKVSMDDDAEKLIRSYFLAARRESSKVVSIGNMGSLIATCLTSARLCLRSFANIDDAVFAIWLHVSGMSPTLVPEEYLQTPADLNHLQKILEQFTNWLEDFTGIRIN